MQTLGIMFHSVVGQVPFQTLPISPPTQSFRALSLPHRLQTPIPVLLYHYVEIVKDKNDTIRQSLDISPAVFEKQIQTLLTAQYVFLTSDEAAQITLGVMQAPVHSVVLTFDDGYQDFYTDVFPILKKYRVKATAYIVPGFLGKLNYMTAGEVQEIAKSGLVEIGAHTMHHRNLKGMAYKYAYEEIWGSKTMLESLTGKPVVSFAYPYGAYDAQAQAIVEKTGFTSGTTTSVGFVTEDQNRFLLPRLRPGHRIGETFLDFFKTLDIQ